MLAELCGHPGRLTTWSPGTASCRPNAPVGFGSGANQATIPGACANRNDGRGAAADFLRNIKSRAAADCAIHAVIGCRNRAFDYDNILALFLANDTLQGRLGSLAIARP